MSLETEYYMLKKILWVFFEKGTLTIIQFVSLIILSRLLGPEDYGIYGIMTIFIAVSTMLVDSGLGGALVQKKDIDSLDINTLFYTNTAISLVLYLALFFSAPFIEQYYGITSLAKYIRVLGISILVFALTQVQNALLARDLQFRKSAIINIIASVISMVAAILIAKKGLGVWALIYQALINSIVVSLLVWITTKTRIGLAVSRGSLNYFWRFGSNVLGANILDVVVSNITTSIIPKIDSIGRSGLYFQASKISNIPINILALSVDKFSFPVLSKEKKHSLFLEKARMINRNLLFVIIPVFPILSYCSYPVVHLVLGEKWLEAAPYFSVLVWSGIGLFIQVLYRNMIKANGITKYLLLVEVVKSLVLLTGIIVSAFYGVWPIIYCVVGMSVFGVILWSICVKKVLDFNYSEQLSDIKKPIISLLIVLATLFIINVPEHSYMRFAVIVLVSMEYLVISYLLRNEELIIMLNRVKGFLHKQ